MAKGLGRGQGFTWPWNLSERLPEEVDLSTVFQLWALEANIVRRHPRPPDVPVYGLHQSDGNPTLDVSAHPRVGLLPLCCEATSYPFRAAIESTPIIP